MRILVLLMLLATILGSNTGATNTQHCNIGGKIMKSGDLKISKTEKGECQVCWCTYEGMGKCGACPRCQAKGEKLELGAAVMMGRCTACKCTMKGLQCEVKFPCDKDTIQSESLFLWFFMACLPFCA